MSEIRYANPAQQWLWESGAILWLGGAILITLAVCGIILLIYENKK